MANPRLFASAPRTDARAARAPARLGGGEGVARFICQRVGERDQSRGGFQVLQRYEPS